MKLTSLLVEAKLKNEKKASHSHPTENEKCSAESYLVLWRATKEVVATVS